ncbi:tumor protein p53-inducible nuclear protein 2-like isoform X1 [Macrobrachium nipponense]|uniref:tumor protein p53-inducible nuclear protein 2-like isoform X1 n=2 Tax=Macrobrachium nipponense TaxID=159736 RepID=UPI0030C7F83F
MGSYAQSVHEKMLANLTSLIWGSNENTPPTPATNATTKNDATEKTEDALLDTLGAHNIRASTPSDDDDADWVLVDRAEVDEACNWEGQVPPQWMTEAAAIPSVPVPTSSPVLCTGETSDGGPQEWLMTPPPCFTRSQAAPLASSPLENLLIEHPSMSVYLPRPTYTSAATARIFPRRLLSHSSHSRSPPSVSPSSLPTSGEREESPMREETSSEVGGGQQVDIPTIGRTTGVAQRTANLIQAIDVLRPAQKAQRRREERRLKHKHLDRTNKAREVASAGNKRSKRREMLTPSKFSRAVNNRKC